MLKEDILYFVDQYYQRRVAVPDSMYFKSIMPHLLEATLVSRRHIYGALKQHWWWDAMYSDALKFVTNCPESQEEAATIGLHYTQSLSVVSSKLWE